MTRATKRKPLPRRAPRPTRARPARAAVNGPPAGDATADSTRDKILATALRVFAERGFEGARTREIAERAGANLGLITYYFRNKETLWRAAVTHAFAELQAELTAVTPSTDPRLQLEQLARRFVRFVARRPEFMCLMNDEGKRDSPRMRWLADRFVKPMREGLGQLIEQGQASGLLPPVSPVSLHYIFLGAAGLIFSQAQECRRIMGVDPTTEAFAEAHADAVIRFLTGRQSSE